jgi:hypothetical protein
MLCANGMLSRGSEHQFADISCLVRPSSPQTAKRVREPFSLEAADELLKGRDDLVHIRSLSGYLTAPDRLFNFVGHINLDRARHETRCYTNCRSIAFRSTLR